MVGKVKTIFQLFKEAGQAWAQDSAPMLAAALAYYTTFSLAPLLLLAVAIAGFVFGERAVAGEIVTQIEGAVGSEAAVLIQSILASTSSSSANVLATIISTAILFFGASGVFNQLKKAFNIIWGVENDNDSGLDSLLALIKARLLALGMVLGIGFMLLLSIALNAIVSLIDSFLLDLSPALATALPLLDLITSGLIPLLLIAIIFRTMPDADVRWRDVWWGALLTLLLLSLGNQIIGRYLSSSSIGSAYGAAGSLIIFLLWIYYSAQIFLFGAEFTKVYATQEK